MSNWLLTNKKDCRVSDLNMVYECAEFAFYAKYKEENIIKAENENSNVLVFVDGYIMPRKDHFNDYSHLKMPDLILTLYKEYRKEFIRYIKGIFNIIIIEDNYFQIFNDRAGIKKFFYSLEQNQFIITSNLKHISDNKTLKINSNSVPLFSLMEHFIAGYTLFERINFSMPATNITFNKNIEVKRYWDCGDLIELQVKEYSYEEIADSFKIILENYLNYFKPKITAVTLTGGHDSRTIVSALLNLGAEFRTFTFGNPLSFDGIVADTVAKYVNVEHTNYFVNNPSADWYNTKAEQLIQMGSSLFNIHRAHRLDAIEQEITHNPDVEMLFIGIMGGEYIRGISLDDYITPKLARLWWFSNKNKNALVRDLLSERFIKEGIIDLDQIINILSNQKYLSNEEQKKNEYFINQELIGSIHSGQDINIYGNYVKYVVDIYMDIDFLEILFSSKHSMMSKYHTSLNPIKRINDPALACNLIRILFPRLTNIEFARYYSPKEFLGNKLIYLSKRALRLLFSRKYPANFPYEKWFKEFVFQNIARMDQNISEYFDCDKLIYAFEHDQHQSNEGYWHRFTNPINLSMISRYYIQ